MDDWPESPPLLIAFLNYNPAMMKIECKGMTPAEVKELRAYLKAQTGVEDVQLEIKLEGIQRRSGYGVTAPEEIWLLVKVAATSSVFGGVVGAAVSGAAGEAGKDLYRVIKDWLRKKNIPQAQATLYGADGNPIENANR